MKTKTSPTPQSVHSKNNVVVNAANISDYYLIYSKNS